MKKKVFDIQSKLEKKMIAIALISILYFGLLAFTIYQKITEDGLTENLVQVAIIVTAFALGAYYMYYSSLRKLQKRHVPENTRMEHFEISEWRIQKDKIIAMLFLIVGVLFMILTLL